MQNIKDISLPLGFALMATLIGLLAYAAGLSTEPIIRW
jgi:hypothetical protein